MQYDSRSPIVHITIITNGIISTIIICMVAGCTDVDDALSARQLPNGQLEVGVHIADVSSFVKQVSRRPQCAELCLLPCHC